MNKENISKLQNLKDKSLSPIKVLDFKTDFIFSILKPSFYKGRCGFIPFGNLSFKESLSCSITPKDY